MKNSALIPLQKVYTSCRHPWDLHSWLSKDAPLSSEVRAFVKSLLPAAASIYKLQ